jgi:hypothetical protein
VEEVTEEQEENKTCGECDEMYNITPHNMFRG